MARERRGNDLLMLGLAGAATALAASAVIRRRRSYSLHRKVALITGGSRGLGLVLARELVSEGARLALAARNHEELERARLDLAARGAAALTLPCDVTDRDQVRAAIDRVREHYGRVDVLINNAGQIQVGPMEEMTLEDYENALRIHFWAPLYAILEVLPEMRGRREGRIVNISSIGGRISVPHLLPYCASKFALTGLSEGLRAELAKDGIAVTTVCPGLMRTGSPPNAAFKGKHREEYAWFSISDSLPLITASAEHAARRVIAACKRGDAEVALSLPAHLALPFHGLFPGVTADLLGWANRLLPGAGGIGTESAAGRDSESEITRSWLTALTERAARRNNELPGEASPGTG